MSLHAYSRIAVLALAAALAAHAFPSIGVKSAGAQNRKRVTVPEAVVRRLAGDEHVKECLEQKGGAGENLVAYRIEVNGEREPEVLVHGINTCICGANNCTHWLFRKTPSGYELLLETGAIQLFELRKTSTNGYRDVQTSMHGSATEHDLTVYKFNGRRYRRAACMRSSHAYLDGRGLVRQRRRPLITRVKCEPEPRSPR